MSGTDFQKAGARVELNDFGVLGCSGMLQPQRLLGAWVGGKVLL